MGEYLAGKAYGNTLGALCEQKGELDGKFHGLIGLAVVGFHPPCGLLVEGNLFCELAETAFYVPRGGASISGKDITPVTLGVYQKPFLPQGDKCSENGCVSVGVVGHYLADNFGRLGQTAVVVHVH